MGDDFYYDDISGYGQDYDNADSLYGAEPLNYYTDYSSYVPESGPTAGGYFPDSNQEYITQGEANSLYGAQPEGFYQEPGMLDKALDYLSSKQGQGLLSLGLGGLSLYGSYLSNQQKANLAKAQTQLAKGDQRLGAANDFAKMHALAQIIQARQGINLDPSLAYAQAVRNDMGLSPKNATPFAGIDVGGPLQAGGGSQQKLATLNSALGYNFAQGGGVQGGLGLLRNASSGQADDIQANLSGGEYVFDADTVAALGDGNTEAGAARLDEMRKRIRKHKRSAPADKIPPAAHDPMKYLGGK